MGRLCFRSVFQLLVKKKVGGGGGGGGLCFRSAFQLFVKKMMGELFQVSTPAVCEEDGWAVFQVSIPAVCEEEDGWAVFQVVFQLFVKKMGGLCFRSAFQLFVKKKIVGMEGSLKEKMVALGQQWKALGTKQRKYFKKCTAQQELYRQQLEEFKQVSSFKQHV